MSDINNFHTITSLASQMLSHYFQTSIHFNKIIQLNEPDRRNQLLRLVVDNPVRGIPSSFILKKNAIEKNVFESSRETETAEEQFNRFAHDWAGLEFLTSIEANHGPRFYCGNIPHQFIIIEDLGNTHHSLVGPLTRANTPENYLTAENALKLYIKRIGKMHADTAGKFAQYQAILKRINPNALHYNNIPNKDGDKLLKIISNLITNVPQELISEIEKIIDYSQSANEFHVLLHGDICPDNVFYYDNDIRLIDFEFADFGNALIDASYLRMHMPSCWCSKAVPNIILDKMEKIYRAELMANIHSANDTSIYQKQLVSACGYWLLRTINQIEQMGLMENEWICPSGPLEEDSKWEPEKNAFRPRIISRLKAFIESDAKTHHYPKLLQCSKLLLSHLQKQWSDVADIGLFPVFKD